MFHISHNSNNKRKIGHITNRNLYILVVFDESIASEKEVVLFLFIYTSDAIY
jgi:hypothetical protein